MPTRSIRPLRFAFVAVALFVVATFFAAHAPLANAATQRTWVGASGSNWSTPANWSPAGAPVSGDSLLFPATASSFTTNSDIPSLTIASIEVNGSYAIAGLPLAITSSITLTPGTTTISAPITLGGPTTITVAQYSTLTLAGAPQSIDLNGHALTVQGAGEVDVTGGVTGFASISVAPSAVLVFEAPTTYIGATNVSGGVLVLANGAISPPGVTTVSADGAIGGTGSVGALVVTDALFFPGIGGSPATFSALNASFTAQSIARFRLTAAAANGYDTLALTGPVDLGGAKLELRWDTEPTVGQQYTIISGATSLAGTFAGLPEGSVLTTGGRRFSITYKGGGGHDVVLTRIPAVSADLFVTLAAPASVRPDATATFTVTATNRGPGDAPLPAITLDLAPGFLFQSVSAPAGYVCDTPGVGVAGQVRCQGTSLANGARAVITVVAKPAPGASGAATVHAAVSSAANESASADNSTSASITIASDARPYRAYAVNIAAG